MSLSRLVAGLVALASITAVSAAEACPPGVEGIADPGSTVCAEDLATNLLYCDVADASGHFFLIGAFAPMSTGSSCLPVHGQFYFFEVGCEKEGIPVDRNDPSEQNGGSWLDLRCDGTTQGGSCDHGSYSDGSVSYAPTAPISILMCQCDLLDPACGVGTCSGGAYSEGSACSSPVSFPPSSVVSQAMCAGVTLDPKTCDVADCEPYSGHQSAGVCDKFNKHANSPESPSPSADLLAYIGSIYAIPGIRDFDATFANRWFGHTFTGLTPQGGAHICGARLTATIGQGVGGSWNDTLGLLFVDASGTPTGTSYYSFLSSYGISGGSSATVTLDIGSLPGGAAMLAQMENGWLDFIVQDDSAVDCLDLEIDYCCPCEPSSLAQAAGTCDAFDGSNGAEQPSPSADLLAYIGGIYAIPGSRDFDDVGSNQWFGHTFTGLAPQHGKHICGAQLTATIGKGTEINGNDTLGLLFVDASGTPTGASYYSFLSSYGISGGSSATVTLDIGSLPGGAAMLAQMENGWLDFIVQDDSAVDCLSLNVDYCCDDSTK